MCLLVLKLPHVVKAVDSYMGQRFKDFRCKLHKHYQKFENSDLSRQNPYKNVAEEVWQKVCDRIESPEFQKLSTINTTNRDLLKVNHSTGSKPFARYREEQRDKDTQEELGRIELYRRTHTKGDKWTCYFAEEKYNEMLELQAQSSVEDSPPLTEDAICAKVLGKRPGYIKGLGHGVFPPSSSSYSQSDMSAANKRAEDAEKRNEELMTQMQDQSRQLEELQLWKNTMAAEWAKFLAERGTPS